MGEFRSIVQLLNNEWKQLKDLLDTPDASQNLCLVIIILLSLSGITFTIDQFERKYYFYRVCNFIGQISMLNLSFMPLDFWPSISLGLSLLTILLNIGLILLIFYSFLMYNVYIYIYIYIGDVWVRNRPEWV